MKDEIKVSVVEFGDRKTYQLQYRDPITGRKKTKTTDVERDGSKKSRRDAEKAAGKWEDELREGRYHAPSKLTWADFRERYENEVLASLSEATDLKVSGVFNAVEKIINPQRIRDLTADRLSAYQAKLREGGRSENTIKGHLAHLRAALSWGKRMGFMAEVPAIDAPRRAKGAKMMKGRPITSEEFERVVAKAAAEVGEEHAASWRHLLEGLWWSGLRMAESLELSWDRDDKLCIDLSGKRPMLRIPAALEKGNQDRLLPMAPEFAEFLMATPEAARTGYVFNPGSRRGGGRLGMTTVSRIISNIGERALVKVNTDLATGDVKYASAHDLRRSFGERWASRVMPQVLMELMRHESIDTTMRYYVGRNAQSTAEILWQAHEQTSNNSGNTMPARAVL